MSIAKNSNIISTANKQSQKYRWRLFNFDSLSCPKSQKNYIIDYLEKAFVSLNVLLREIDKSTGYKLSSWEMAAIFLLLVEIIFLQLKDNGT